MITERRDDGMGASPSAGTALQVGRIADSVEADPDPPISDIKDVAADGHAATVGPGGTFHAHRRLASHAVCVDSASQTSMMCALIWSAHSTSAGA